MKPSAAYLPADITTQMQAIEATVPATVHYYHQLGTDAVKEYEKLQLLLAAVGKQCNSRSSSSSSGEVQRLWHTIDFRSLMCIPDALNCLIAIQTRMGYSVEPIAHTMNDLIETKIKTILADSSKQTALELNMQALYQENYDIRQYVEQQNTRHMDELVICHTENMNMFHRYTLLETTHADVIAQLRMCENDLTFLRNEIQTLRTNMKDEKSRSESIIRSLKTDVSHQKDELLAGKTKLSTTSTKLADVQHKLERVQKTLSTTQQSHMEANVADTQKLLTDAEHKLQATQDELEQCRNTQAVADVQSLIGENEVLETDNQRLRIDLGELQAAIANLESTSKVHIANSMAQVELFRDDIANLKLICKEATEARDQALNTLMKVEDAAKMKLMHKLQPHDDTINASHGHDDDSVSDGRPVRKRRSTEKIPKAEYAVIRAQLLTCCDMFLKDYPEAKETKRKLTASLETGIHFVKHFKEFVYTICFRTICPDDEALATLTKFNFHYNSAQYHITMKPVIEYLSSVL